MADRQLALRFPYTPGHDAVDFLPHKGNALALEFVAAPERWPAGRLALWGAQGCGKSHLLHIWADDHGAGVIDAASLREPFWPEGPVAIDDVDRLASEEALLHLLNAATEAKRRVLLTATRAPSRLGTKLPDLASRLRATTAVEMQAPDDAFLAVLLTRLLADRQLTVRPDIQSWLLTVLPRMPAVLREAVARLDYAALAAKSPVTRALATETLADFLHDAPYEEPIS